MLYRERRCNSRILGRGCIQIDVECMSKLNDKMMGGMRNVVGIQMSDEVGLESSDRSLQ